MPATFDLPLLEADRQWPRRGLAEPPESALASGGRLEIVLASCERDVEQAQRLRYRVFARELGACIGSAQGVDRDAFDPYCRHLVARDRDSGEVVGTYRVLLPEQAAEAGRLYTDGEFVLDRIDALRPWMVELGRSCVHPDYRGGATLMLLWSGLGALLARTSARYLIGCVSVPVRDGGRFAASLYRQLARSCLSGEHERVRPRSRLPVELLAEDLEVAPPPLMKGYLRAGARLLGEPHVDLEFGCADFPMMLELEALQSRYGRRFAARPSGGVAQ